MSYSGTYQTKEKNKMNNTKKILIIDDDPNFLFSVGSLLRANKYTVVTAMNPQRGLDKLVSEKPDLVLLDIMMDSLFDGFALCHEIKTSKKYKDYKSAPVIFVSAVKEKSGSRFQFNAGEQGLVGPDDYIDKPVKPNTLLSCIEKHLNN